MVALTHNKLRTVSRTAFAVLALLVLTFVLIVRPWYMSWGAAESDLSMAMSADAIMPAAATVSTRVITIDAPPSVVWGWIVQLGQGRGGFYSYDWLENLFAAQMRNAETIDPDLAMRVGDTISYQQNGPFDRVTAIVPGREMIVGDGWEWYLAPIDGNRTRLIVRYGYDCSSSWAHRIFYYTVFEPAHFVMESGMMMGIKERSEQSMVRTTSHASVSRRRTR
jgi:hypothetical protein